MERYKEQLNREYGLVIYTYSGKTAIHPDYVDKVKNDQETYVSNRFDCRELILVFRFLAGNRN